MAEFVQVMEQWGRLCSTHIGHDCSGCVLTGTDVCDNYARDNERNAAEIEKRVMTWAKEHPEPRYPSWQEWLEEQCIISAGGLYEKAFMPIPDDIAKKLGIEPKEANSDA